MKKIVILGLMLTVFSLSFMGCNNTLQDVSNKVEKNKTEDSTSEDSTSEDSNDTILPSPEFETEIVSNNNELEYTSTITTKDDRVTKSYKLDKQIQEELENGGHTFWEPFVILNPFGNSPLTAVVLFETEEEYAVRITVQGNTDETDVIGNVDASTLHRVPVIGLYPDKENEVIIELLDNNGNVVDKTKVLIQTDALPSSMDNLVEVENNIEASSYGLLEVSGFDTPHPFAFDTEGDVRWYLSESYASYGYFPLSDGRFVVMDKDVMTQTYEKPHAQQLYEMDYLGRVHQIYLIEKGAHHEIIEMTPGGNLLVLTNSIDEHVEDVVEEIDRKTGKIVKSLDMREIFGDTYVDMVDWAHLNTASYNEKDDTIILSPRNIHSGIKVNWSTNELVWILGDPEFWAGTPFEDKVLQPEGDIIWHYQPHSIYEIKQDLDGDSDTIHVMLFDNHWDKTRKVKSFDDLEYSYVSLYTINEETMTVIQPHIYEGVKSKITSNYRYNYEKSRVFFMGGYLAKETEDGKNGMIYEYDYETEEVLNQYSLRYTFYRAYEFEPDFSTCASLMELNDNYLAGTLRATSLNKESEKVPSDILEEGVKFSINNQLLYIKAKDHKVSKVEFIGKNQSYLLDLSYTKGEKKYQKLNYNIVVPFSNLAEDEYQIVVTYDGTRYDTGETITMK